MFKEELIEKLETSTCEDIKIRLNEDSLVIEVGNLLCDDYYCYNFDYTIKNYNKIKNQRIRMENSCDFVLYYVLSQLSQNHNFMEYFILKMR